MQYQVVIGMGGSGTRIPGEVFHRLGYDLGNDLNVAYDNLVIDKAFGMYRKIDLNQIDYSWFKKTLLKAIEASYSKEPRVLKTPNMLYFLPQLKKLGEEEGIDFHLIHMVRDGLYMVNNQNQNQYTKYGKFFDLKECEHKHRVLEFWCKVNLMGIKQTKELGFNCHKLIYDKIVENPEAELKGLLTFLHHEKDFAQIATMVEAIQAYKPAAYKDQLETFPQHLQQQVLELML